MGPGGVYRYTPWISSPGAGAWPSDAGLQAVVNSRKSCTAASKAGLSQIVRYAVFAVEGPICNRAPDLGENVTSLDAMFAELTGRELAAEYVDALLACARGNLPKLNERRREVMDETPESSPTDTLVVQYGRHEFVQSIAQLHSRSVQRRKPLATAFYADAARSSPTRRAYASDMAAFSAWGGRVPASPETVASYLAASDSLAAATLRRRLAAIADAHQVVGHPDPTKHPWSARSSGASAEYTVLALTPPRPST